MSAEAGSQAPQADTGHTGEYCGKIVKAKICKKNNKRTSSEILVLLIMLVDIY